MGIFGSRKIAARTREVTIGFDDKGAEIKLVLHAPGLEAMDLINERLPKPSAPILKDAFNNPQRAFAPNGDPLVDDNGAMVYQRNHNDTKFKAAKKKHTRAQTVAILMHMTDEISPSAPRPDVDAEGEEVENPDWLSYYYSGFKEMVEEGLTLAVLGELNAAAEELLSPMSVEEIEIARARYGSDKKNNEAVKAAMKAAGKPVPSGK